MKTLLPPLNIGATFSEALNVLKEGRFVRRTSWRNSFLALVGPHAVPVSSVGDEGLKKVLDGAWVAALSDRGNIRKFDIAEDADIPSVEVTNGWSPAPQDMMTDDWILYDPEEVELSRGEWELSDIVNGRYTTGGGVVPGKIAQQLDQLGVAYDLRGHVYCGDPDTDEPVALRLNGDELKGIYIEASNAKDAYVIWVHDKYTSKPAGCVPGRGRLLEELHEAKGYLPQPEISPRKFYRHLFTLEVVSEDEIPEGTDMGDIWRDAQEGDSVAAVSRVSTDEIDARQCVATLERLGSQADFFQLTEGGQDAG